MGVCVNGCSYGLRQIGLYGTMTTILRHTARMPHKTSRPTTWNGPRPRRDAETFWAKTETRPETYRSETEMLSTLSETRPRRDVVSSRDCLGTETSRPRPHPCSQHLFVTHSTWLQLGYRLVIINGIISKKFLVTRGVLQRDILALINCSASKQRHVE